MPRKKQGQATRVTERLLPDAKVKKIKQNGVTKVCNDPAGKISHHKFLLCKVKKVSATKVEGFIQNGASVLLKGNKYSPGSIPVKDLNKLHNTCEELKIASQAVQNVLETVQPEVSKTNIALCNSGNERNIKDSWSQLPKSTPRAEMNNSGTAFDVDEAASKRAGISVITRFNIAKDTSPVNDERFDFLNCLGTNSSGNLKEDSIEPNVKESRVSFQVRNPPESQSNYRISSTVIETRANILQNDRLIGDTSEILTSKQQQCSLSSVYGMPASNIETLLTGLPVKQQPQQSCLIINPATELSHIPIIISNSTLTVNCGNACAPSATVSEPSKKLIAKESVITSNLVNCRPKLHIPDLNNFEDYNSLLQAADQKKVGIMPKVTSPQILEQHISKIISQNTAIVETLDPLWSKRYMRQSSQNSEESRKSNNTANRGRRLSNDKIVIDTGQSKLQSALLGTLNPERRNSFSLAKTDDIRERSFSTSSLPAARSLISFSSELPSPKMRNVASEEELKGNAIKSLLSLKQGKYPSGNNSFQLCKDNYSQHPQNPEGSIIKDLLLKKKSEAKSSATDLENSTQKDFCSSAENNSEKPHHCSKCGSKYPNEKLLNVHMLLCNNKGSLSVCKLGGKSNSSTNGFLVSKFISAENMTILNPSVLSSSIEDLLKNDPNPSVKLENECVGPILKTQLLSPLTNRKSPPLKKRKISEPIILPENQNDSSNKSAAASLPFDANSSQRCRSQSVHLFGGKVQIQDGDKMKRLKVLTCLSSLSLNDYKSTAKYSEASRDEVDSFQTVIAQPVHNSGGTVTQVPIRKMPSSPMVPVTIANDISTVTNSSDAHGMAQKIQMISLLPNQMVGYDYSPIRMLNNVPVIQKTGDLLKTNALDGQFSSSPDQDYKTSTFFEHLDTSSHNTHVPEKTDLLFRNVDLGSGSQGSPHAVITQNVSNLIQRDEASSKESNRADQPAIMFTPSSPTHSSSKKDFTFSVSKPEAKDEQKYLSPARPTSLPLKRKPFTMVGSTLVSPDTPRPKKSCVQMYINGQAYTYLGLKCSTRSTYCCIYRPQPMFVQQETDPKLSMYSNWQVVPAKEEQLNGLTPGQMLSFYNSRQSVSQSDAVTTTAKIGEPLSFTHSSYWKFRSLKKDSFDPTGISGFDSQSEVPSPSEDIPEEAANLPIYTSQSEPATTSASETSVCNEDLVPSSLDGKLDPASDNCSNLEVEASDVEGTNTQDEEDDDDDDDDDDRTEVTTDSSQSQPPKRVKIFEGGFKSNEDYTYIRGRGRGKYVCEECGIRCKKPSMLKKHIRTHTDLRPYKCRHCSFAFKTKGNLTKHMKSKAHHKKCTELGIIPVPTTSDDSQIDEEALAKQEQLRKRNLLFSDGEDIDDDDDDDDEIDDSDVNDEDYESDSSSVTTSKIVSIPNGPLLESDSADNIMTEMDTSNTSHDPISQCSIEQEAARSLLHLSSLSDNSQWASSTADLASTSTFIDIIPVSTTENTEVLTNTSIIQHQTSSSVLVSNVSSVAMKRSADPSEEPIGHRPRSYSADVPFGGSREHLARQQQIGRNIFKASSDSASDEASEFSRDGGMRRYSISVAREARRPCIVQSPHCTSAGVRKIQTEGTEQPMDLRITRGSELLQGKHFIASFSKMPLHAVNSSEGMTTLMSSDAYGNETYPTKQLLVLAPQTLPDYDNSAGHSNSFVIATSPVTEQAPGNTSFSQSRHYYPSEDIAEESHIDRVESDLLEERGSPEASEYSVCSPVSPTSMEDNFVLQEGVGTANSPDEMPGLMRNPLDFMKPGTSSNLEEGKCICRICNKIFAKAGQLRIHVNIHYFERPFRCDNCGVSFRTKGHLQKHKRSVSHYNKVNMNMTFGTPSVDNPRPFKCADCKIAFRIHGHLAKHLRSKMHIMKLECLGKLPFGMYAEMERSGVSLNEIDTTDCSNSLESLQVMAQKLYQRDPRRMRWHSPNHESPTDIEVTKCPSMGDALLPVPEQLSVALNSPSAISVHVPSIVSLSPTEKSNENEVKHEPAETVVFPSNSVLVSGDIQLPSTSHYNTDQNRTVVSPQTTGPGESNISLHRSDTCHICGRMFKSAKFLQVHLYCDHSSWNPNSSETLSPSSPRMTVIAQDLSCDLCGRHFPNQTSLQQHLLTHAQIRPFVCEVCDAGFTSSASLVAHLGTHHSLDAGSTE